MRETRGESMDEAGEDHPPDVRAGIADERFAVNFRHERERHGLSQGEVARRMAALGWPYYQQTVARIEEGKRKASVGEAEALARIVKTTADRLTMPSLEASLTTLLNATIARVVAAYEEVGQRTTALLAAQRQLTLSVDEAQAAKYCGSPLVRKLSDEARQVITLDPYEAVEVAVEEAAAGFANPRAQWASNDKSC
jgi:transcriptional regulator with XRE-family HTH domain